MFCPSRRRILLIVASPLVLSLCASAGAAEAGLAAAPLMLLACSLMVGCYPGEHVVAGMAARVAQRTSGPQRTLTSGARRRPLAPRVARFHGGLLIAHSRCGRAPPALAG